MKLIIILLLLACIYLLCKLIQITYLFVSLLKPFDIFSDEEQ